MALRKLAHRGAKPGDEFLTDRNRNRGRCETIAVFIIEVDMHGRAEVAGTATDPHRLFGIGDNAHLVFLRAVTRCQFSAMSLASSTPIARAVSQATSTVAEPSAIACAS